MKKLICALMAFMIIVSLTACSSGKEPDTTASEETTSGRETVTETEPDTQEENTAEEEIAEPQGVTVGTMSELFEYIADFAPGTAGSSLKAAGRIYSLLSYAADNELYAMDREELLETAKDAYLGLDVKTALLLRLFTGDESVEELLPAYEECSVDFLESVDRVLDDPDDMSSSFDDIEVRDKMEKMADSIHARESWDALKTTIRNVLELYS